VGRWSLFIIDYTEVNIFPGKTLLKITGRLDSVEWNGGLEWWNGLEWWILNTSEWFSPPYNDHL